MNFAQMLSDVDEVLLQALEAPGLVGVHDAVAVVFEQALVEVDDAAHEARREDADAAIVEQVDALRLAALREHRVIAQVRIAVDHAEAAEGHPPRLEHGGRDAVALLERCCLKVSSFSPSSQSR